MKKILLILISFISPIIVIGQVYSSMNVIGGDTTENLVLTGQTSGSGILYTDANGKINNSGNGAADQFMVLDASRNIPKWHNRYPVTNITSNYTASDTDYIILADAGSNNIFVTVPTTGIPIGKPYIIKGINSSTNDVKIVSATSIDGNGDTLELSADNQAVKLEYDGAKYYIISSYTPHNFNLTQTGNTSFTLFKGQHLMVISVWPTSNETISIGTSPGGTDIEPATAITGGSHKDFLIGGQYSLTGSTTVYLSGASGSVIYNIVTQ